MDETDRGGLAKLVFSCAEDIGQCVEGVQNCIEELNHVDSWSGATAGAIRHSTNIPEKMYTLTNRLAHVGCRMASGTDSSADNRYFQEQERKIKEAYKDIDRMAGNVCAVAKESTCRLKETRMVQVCWDAYNNRTPEEEVEPLFKCKRCGGLQEKEVLETIADANLEIVGPGEKVLADNLRGWCTPYGEERRKYLSESAAALLRLGKLHLHKAVCSTAGALQKLSFIRCFSLLSAARVRIELNPTEESFDEVYNAQRSMNQALLKASNSDKKEPEKLALAVEEIVQAVESARDAARQDLEIFDKKREQQKACFRDTAELNGAQNGRINGVKALNENVTQNYLSIMQNISEKCVLILGEPPAKFAVAGLGSLARKEITLYSDFEHVILLEDTDHSEKVYEYFRWFTVLFQVIIIGLGETIVPTVCVKSINNLYSSEPSEDCWFFDVYTRCGIAFDGMAPQACATPLGRQLLTKDCNDVEEHIKPINEMLLYLDPKGDLRHGYNLRDLLSCSCYVYGDKDLYDNFHVRCALILKCENPHTVVLQNAERIVQNPNQQVRDGFSDARGLAKFNAKSAYYRPFVVLIGSLGRIHNIQAIETFEVLDKLKTKGAINDILHHKLSFAFAVICEMRARVYTKEQTQRRVLNLEDIQEMIGGEAEWACKDMMQYLQESVPEHEKAASGGNGMIQLQQFNEQYVVDSPRNQIRGLYFCGQYKRAVECAQEHIQLCEHWSDREIAIFEYWLFKCYYQAGRAEDKRDYWDALEQIYLRLTRWPDTFEREKAECFCIMAEVYEAQRRFKEAYVATRKWLLFYLKAGTSQPIHRHKLPEIYKKYIVAAGEHMKPGDEEVHHFLMELANEKAECQYTSKCMRAVISIIADRSPEAFLHLCEVAEEIKTKARNIVEPRMLLKMIWALQVNNQRWSEAIRTAEYINEFPDISCTEAEHRAIKDKRWAETLQTCTAGEFIDTLGTVYGKIKKTFAEIDL